MKQDAYSYDSFNLESQRGKKKSKYIVSSESRKVSVYPTHK
jgi:hypothetical protein